MDFTLVQVSILLNSTLCLSGVFLVKKLNLKQNNELKIWIKFINDILIKVKSSQNYEKPLSGGFTVNELILYESTVLYV